MMYKYIQLIFWMSEIKEANKLLFSISMEAVYLSDFIGKFDGWLIYGLLMIYLMMLSGAKTI